MDNAQHRFFLAEYRAMTNDALIELYAKRDSLAEAALSSLNTVIEERKLSDGLRGVEATQGESVNPSRPSREWAPWQMLAITGLAVLLIAGTGGGLKYALAAGVLGTVNVLVLYGLYGVYKGSGCLWRSASDTSRRRLKRALFVVTCWALVWLALSNLFR